MTDDLFERSAPASYPDVPGHKGRSETSAEAACHMAPKCGRLQQMTLDAIREAGSRGLTADEAAEALGLSRWSIQPRVSELAAKRLIRDSGLRRHNVTGRRAVVWVAVEFAKVAA